jgi:hypothetical protein
MPVPWMLGVLSAKIDGPNSPPFAFVPWHDAQRVKKIWRPALAAGLDAGGVRAKMIPVLKRANTPLIAAFAGRLRFGMSIHLQF